MKRDIKERATNYLNQNFNESIRGGVRIIDLLVGFAESLNEEKEVLKESNTVSAEEFLKSIHELDNIWDLQEDAEYNERQLVQFAERYHQSKENNNWISVEKELPKDYDVVNVQNERGRVGTDEFLSGKFINAESNGLKVVYWQPLPTRKK